MVFCKRSGGTMMNIGVLTIAPHPTGVSVLGRF
jgi:hypothetical protein